MKKQVNRGLIWSFVVIFLVLLFDQILKVWVKTNMSLNDPIGIPLLGNWFSLKFVENDGIAFGLLSEGGILKFALSLFRIVAVAALFWVLVWLSKRDTKPGVMIGVALITAGALGNIIDCVFYGKIFHYAGWLHGKVVDMFSISFFPPVFNLADAAITIGVFYMLIFQWKWLKSLQ